MIKNKETSYLYSKYDMIKNDICKSLSKIKNNNIVS